MGRVRRWMPEEDDRIRDLWQSCSVAQIGVALKRNRNCVRIRARQLELPSKPRSKPETISLRGTPRTGRRVAREDKVRTAWAPGVVGLGRAFEFRGRKLKAGPVVHAALVGDWRGCLLPPRADLVDAGDCRLDWRTEPGLAQLAVAILAWLRPEGQKILQRWVEFAQWLRPRLASDRWTLKGAEVEEWLKAV